MAKVMVSFPDDFLRKVDRQAKTQNRTRSELIREALREVLGGRDGEPLRWSRAVERLGWLEGAWVDRWDSTDVIRRDRDRRHDRQDRR